MPLLLFKSMHSQSPWLGIWSLLMIVSSVWLAFYVHQFFDYGFGVWYQLLDIQQHIEVYAPQNYYKADFSQLTQQAYLDLFSQISWAVNHGGAGLAEISYTVGDITRTLLRQPEVVHLQDVAHLIDVVNALGVSALALFAVLTVYLVRSKVALSWLAIGTQLVAFIGVLSVILLVIGPKKVFYWFHIALFPSENQWFFYYQESLMVTLMKAPDLFAGIGVSIILLAIGLLIASCYALSCWMKRY